MNRTFTALISFIFIFCYSCRTAKKTVASSVTAADVKPGPSQIPNHPLVSDKDLDILLNEIGNRRIVLLGDDSHGTSEYYTWRAAITKRLIKEKGFNLVALEADWSDTYRLNDLFTGIKKESSEIISLLRQYNRWPQWLWANKEFAEMLLWMNGYTLPQIKESVSTV